jgi:hypothetical protein
VSATTLGGIGFAAQQAGADLEGAAKAFGKLNLYIAQAQNGNADAVANFAKLGITLADLRNLKPDEIFAKIADAFSGFDDDANKAAGAFAFFGKNYQSVLPLLDEGGDKLRKNIEYFKRYSGVTQDLVERSDQFNDSLTKLNLLNKAFGSYLASALLPSVQGLADKLLLAKENSTAFQDAATGIVEPLKVLAKFAFTAFTAFDQLGIALGGRAAQLAALARLDFSAVKSIGDDLAEQIAKSNKLLDEFKKGIDAKGTGAFVGPPAPGKGTRPTPPFGLGTGGAKKEADEYARALQRVRQAAAEADLELSAMFSTQEITGAQKAMAALTASDAWKTLTEVQKQDLTARYQAIDAVQRETLEWKKKREEQEKSIKVLEELQQKQEEAVKAFTGNLGQYAEENSILERQIDLVGKDDLARQKLAETIQYEQLRKQALAADDLAGLEILDKQFQKRIALIEQLSAATERFAQIQQYNAIFVNAFADGLTDIVTGTKSVKEAFRDMERAIVQSISRIAAQNLAEAIFGTSKTGGGGIGEMIAKMFGGSGGFDFSSILQSIFGGLFGGGGGGLSLGGFARGTNFAPGGMALVGERGPEIVNLPRGSQVIPNDVLKRKGNVTNIFHVNVLPGATTASVRQTRDMLRDAVSTSARGR